MSAARITVRYEGHVQGVGFRYTVLSLSQDFAVAGYIANEPDGSVTLVAEGEEHQLTELLDAIRTSHLGKYIMKEQVFRSCASGEFTDFRICGSRFFR